MYTNKQLNAIYGSNIGFEFEFFSKKDIVDIKNSLSSALDKKIRIEEKAHSDFSPTQETFKLEPDNSGGTGMVELVTGSLPFVEAKLVMAKTLKWINENGKTSDRCSIHINISFDSNRIAEDLNITKLDIGKFVINFDEDKVYEAFPERKDSVYAKSIKFILPLSGMIQKSPGTSIWRNYMFVNEKYYGINFTKIPKGYLEFRYLGGKDYEKNYSKILKLSEHFILSLYETLTNPVYSESDNKKLVAILEKYKIAMDSYRNYELFKENYPNVNLLVDLQTDERIIKMYYPKIREKIFDLITKGGLDEGIINYDSDIGKIQIKDCKLLKCFEISDVDIVDSEIQGNVTNCDIFNTKIKNSSLTSCNLFGDTVCEGSKVKESYVSRNSICNDSYIFGRNGVFSGEMNGGVFREGRATSNAKFKNTEIIEVEKIK